MVGCCKKIEMLEDLFEEYYSEKNEIDNISLIMKIEKILEM